MYSFLREYRFLRVRNVSCIVSLHLYVIQVESNMYVCVCELDCAAFIGDGE